MMAAPSTASGGDLAAAASAAAVDAVVVSYNTRGYLGRCLAELDGLGQRVIVVDSASTDESANLVRERFPAVEVVALRDNRGFGAAANQGIGRVQSRYVLLLNADAWPLAGAVAKLLSVAEQDPRAAVVAPRLMNVDGSPQRSVFGYPTSPVLLASWASFPSAVSRAFQAWRFVQRLVASDMAGECEAVEGHDFPAGAALLVRKEAFDEAGGFDEAFFMYSEETDLCSGLRRLGWRIVFCPAAGFVHVGGASTAQSPDAMYREQLRSYLRFIAKHRGAARADRARKLLSTTLRLRSFASGGGARPRQREIAGWLASGDLETLLR
jgi:N-acetylglucosaminyl-diphospho-decaprenol L-rhamnosyltransferase